VPKQTSKHDEKSSERYCFTLQKTASGPANAVLSHAKTLSFVNQNNIFRTTFSVND
jgi:hypothetical protein